MATIDESLLAELRSIGTFLIDLGSAEPPEAQSCVVWGRMLERLGACFNRPLRIAIMGEGNSGKSLLINYLLRHQILPSGGFSSENTEILIRYAEEASVHSTGADGFRTRITSKAFGRLIKPEIRPVHPPVTSSVIYDASLGAGSNAPSRAGNLVFSAARKNQQPVRLIEVGLPLDFLRRIELIEMRSCPNERSSRISKTAFRRVNLSVWCTLATQAWKETEVLAWKKIPDAHKRGALMLVTYRDAIRRGKDESKITARLRHACHSLFNDITLVSLRDAIQALIAADTEDADQLRHHSNIDAVEAAIAAMIQNWQAQRLHRVARSLRRLAARLMAMSGNMAAPREAAIRLERLASEFLHTSPEISLSTEAA